MAIFDIAGDDGPSVFALPPGRPFFDDLVAALMSDYTARPEELADIRVFVPSRRAVRSLKESFARAAAGRALLLPRFTAIADLNEDDPLLLTLERQFPPLADAPPAAAQRLKLAELYRDALVLSGRPALPWPAAIRAASELSRVADQFTEYGVGSEALDALAKQPEIEDAAAHWKEIAKLLALVTQRYPEWLSERGLLDGRVRRERLLDAVATSLEEDQHTPLILAAGFLGTTPSTERFLTRIARLSRGAVVLPAFDRDLSDFGWEKIEAPHPQSAYRDLLKQGFGDLQRVDVRELPHSDDPFGRLRRQLLSLALMPAEATSDWLDAFERFRSRPNALDAVDGLSVAVASSSEEEADWLALTLREVLETPGRTGALVTADRVLARRVAAKLAGWGVEVDDSGGAPLLGSFRATFLRLIARLMDEPADAAAMAGLIGHQLFGLGLKPQERRPLIKALDRMLRGRSPRKGWDGLLRSLDDEWREHREDDIQPARQILSKLQAIFTQNEIDPSSARVSLDHHLEIAVAIAATPDESGRERLFRFEDGEALEQHVISLAQSRNLLEHIEFETYSDLFDALLAMAPAFRPPGGQHPRLAVLGVLEARLQTADLMVIGGLQEGVWPNEGLIDPFLSNRMRGLLGLPSTETEIGRSAHDFQDFATSRQVLLTRSERAGQAAAKPSRFMVRLETFLKELDAEERVWDAAPRLRALARGRWMAEGPPQAAPPPMPRPPVRLRPTRLSVSALGNWGRDPYAIYADKILRVRPMRGYGQSFDQRLAGTYLHRLAEDASDVMKDDPAMSAAEAINIVREDTVERFDVPADQFVIAGKSLRAAEAGLAVFLDEAFSRGTNIGTEVSGQLSFRAGGRDLTVNGRADRIDQLPEGLHLVDFKKGGSASIKQDQHYSPQLFLLALIAQGGGFQGVEPGPLGQISFVKFSEPEKVFAGKELEQRHVRGAKLQEALAAFTDQFYPWLEHQYQDDTPFPSQVLPFRSSDRGDYDDLARRLEWMRGEESDG